MSAAEYNALPRRKVGSRMQASPEALKAEEFAKLWPKLRRRPKFGNIKVERNGEKFDSQREFRRHLVLVELQREGLITELERQPKFDLFVSGKKVCRYIGDWSYIEHGRVVVEDAKGHQTKEFKIKWKLAQALHPQITWRLS
jgi:hypothetical protein